MDQPTNSSSFTQQFNFGNLAAICLVAVFLLAVSWIKNPSIFSFHKTDAHVSQGDQQDVPHYYAYVAPSEDQQPLVAGANTDPQGPSIINEDGTVTPIANMGQVLGASTENVKLSLDTIAVKEIPDSDDAIKKYFSDSQSIESGYINNTDFQSALSSGDQLQINQQSKKLSAIQENLRKIQVPSSLVRLQKLKIIQYAAAVGLLNNFTQADKNPELVGQFLDQFLKSQQDMDTEMSFAEKKFQVDLGYTTADTENFTVSN
jgi:hypothetical protein